MYVQLFGCIFITAYYGYYSMYYALELFQGWFVVWGENQHI